MALDPSPLSPQPTPLLHPTDPVPGRGSALVGALISVALAVVVGVVSVRAGTALIFLPQGVGANAQAVVDQLPQIQGFDYYWSRTFRPTTYGYDQPSINAKNLAEQAKNYHMNLVVITVTANESYQGGVFSPAVTYQKNADTYPDQTYIDLIKAAQAAGLTPAIKLDIRVVDAANHDPSSTTVGTGFTSGTEALWFNNYAAFAVHYAQMAESLKVPLLIIGHNLAIIATDDATTTYPKPKACETFTNCYGRRDLEWRHVTRAIREATYTPFGNKQRVTAGGDYHGALTFAATVGTAATNDGILDTPEYSTITWWDALDIIGIDAYFPLTKSADLSAAQLKDVWEGKDPSANVINKAGYVAAIKKVHDRYVNLPVLFTAAGYESTTGANGRPGTQPNVNGVPDPGEQVSDMQALLATFTSKPWWLGVVWASDYPVAPRSAASDASITGPNNVALTEPNWATNTEWAGDCLQDAQPLCPNPEKDAGKWLRGFYKPVPLPDIFWQSLHV